MVCEHLRGLVQLCVDQKLRLSSTDLIHIVCEQCGRKEVCPAMLTDEYEGRAAKAQQAASAPPPVLSEPEA
jgi:hypothetical protein